MQKPAPAESVAGYGVGVIRCGCTAQDAVQKIAEILRHRSCFVAGRFLVDLDIQSKTKTTSQRITLNCSGFWMALRTLQSH